MLAKPIATWLWVDWQSYLNWMLQFGDNYGVNPVIFALLYFGTIPFSLLGFSWLVRNLRQGKPIQGPLFLIFICYIGTYIYLFWAGHDIPPWVYGIVVLVMSYTAYLSVKKIRTALRGTGDPT
ncbi:MAG: hypothetical protein AAFV95_23715 [Bacteroidota bacterium]